MEVHVGNSMDNEGNDNKLCDPMFSVFPGQIGTIVCKNGTAGRYVNIKIDREYSRLSICEVAVIGVGKTTCNSFSLRLIKPQLIEYMHGWETHQISLSVLVPSLCKKVVLPHHVCIVFSQNQPIAMLELTS